jgi:hypothetical protein
MRIVWSIEPEDVERVRAFYNSFRDDPFVQQRIERNLSNEKPDVSRPTLWQTIVSCLITTQQRLGPGRAASRFLDTKPFSLRYKVCIAQDNVHGFAHKVLNDFGGLRRTNRIADEVATNLFRLEQGLWNNTYRVLDKLRQARTSQDEREAVEFIDDNFKGFGPKQSRNLLQDLGLTKYEIPIDSRVTKWLNDFGFPVKLSAGALSDRNYYNFVSDGIQELCAQSGVYPCELDAAVFISFER